MSNLVSLQRPPFQVESKTDGHEQKPNSLEITTTLETCNLKAEKYCC